MLSPNIIQKELQGATIIPNTVLHHIFNARLLQIWVPKKYGGLGFRFEEGLQALFDWAKIDGSYGWMLTLCTGANYFSRNMKPDVAEKLFSNATTCFGGSGMIGGTAEIKSDGNYLINGLWHFATGTPYLSHFTLNAKLIKNGEPILDENHNEIISSFIIPKAQATIIPNWKSMGMRASGTYSFRIENIVVSEDYSFIYDTFYTDDVLDKIPFRIFADLTLLVNYLGIAAHFVEEAELIRPNIDFSSFKNSVEKQLKTTLNLAKEIEDILSIHEPISLQKQNKIHGYGIQLVQQVSHQIIQIYTQLGIRATDKNSAIYQVFCDYFTATMHANYRPESEGLDFSFLEK